MRPLLSVGSMVLNELWASSGLLWFEMFFQTTMYTEKSRPYPEAKVKASLTCAVCYCSALSWPHPPAAGSCVGRACAAVVTHLATVHPTVTWLCAAHPPAAGPGRHTQVNHLRKSHFFNWTLAVVDSSINSIAPPPHTKRVTAVSLLPAAPC